MFRCACETANASVVPMTMMVKVQEQLPVKAAAFEEKAQPELHDNQWSAYTNMEPDCMAENQKNESEHSRAE